MNGVVDMPKNELFEILKRESPFLISDIEERYPKYKRSYIWLYINMHKELFQQESLKTGARGRPPVQYKVIGL
jgi:hypothetical protein